MEALLPSEIARLVLGYLEDNKCNEAARIFLETSPHLQECRTVLSKGKRFSTRVSGFTLLDIVEKYSAVSTMIQERLNKVADSEHLKHCGDLLEQLKFLMEETRGQRFVVNINVPSQANQQILNGSPILSGSKRKRHHSNSDRERCKRIEKLLDHVCSESNLPPNHVPMGCDATALESLPGHAEVTKHTNTNDDLPNENNNMTEQQNQCNSRKSSFTDSNHTTDSRDKIATIDMGNNVVQNFDVNIVNSSENRKDDNITIINSNRKCSTGTSTEELLCFSNTEVQTAPCELLDYESESNDEPIQNLSLLTKELLNRTELQERIAENINKAILPTDISLREEKEILNESSGCELSTSIVSELNNAIKSIVEATESDPVFEQFLDEIIGKNVETDTSPDEDADIKSIPVNGLLEKQPDIDLININSQDHTVAEVKTSNKITATEIPLKQRLRSSSRQQAARVEDEIYKQKEQEREHSALEDQNAAAILSIINANITSDKPVNDKSNLHDNKELCVAENNAKSSVIPVPSTSKTEFPGKCYVKVEKIENPKIEKTIPNKEVESKSKKSTIKRPKPTQIKEEAEVISNNLISEQEILTMPTLVLCSQQAITNIHTINQPYAIGNIHPITSASTSHFIPIMPKENVKPKPPPVETLFLKTVNVPPPISLPPLLPQTKEETKSLPNSTPHLPAKENVIDSKLKSIQNSEKFIENTCNPIDPIETNKLDNMESITLYSTENNIQTSLNGANMPAISVEELSPYLKFNSSKSSQGHNLSDIDLVIMENLKTVTEFALTEDKESNLTVSKKTECDIITKRTPRSLLKHRSKTHRLSLSTPRRSSHVRALDFNTPTKVSHSSTKLQDTENIRYSPKSLRSMKSVCRTSLFKSPPFSNSSAISPKFKNSITGVRSSGIPIATRSPVPKLMGGWEKYNGLGVIIDEPSPSKSSGLTSPKLPNKSQKSKTTIKSWDADLRKCLQTNEEECAKSKISPIKKRKTTKSKSDIACKTIKRNPRSSKTKNKKTCDKEKKAVDINKQCVEEQEKKPMSNIQGTEKNSINTLMEISNIPISKNDNCLDALHNASKDVVSVESNSNMLQNVETTACTVKSISTSTAVGTTVENKSVINKNNKEIDKKVKKYVPLKTLRTNLRTLEKEKTSANNAMSTTEVIPNSELPKNTIRQILPISDIIDLKTPRKFENSSGIPPTPRLLSPNSNITTPFIKISDDSNKIRSFINTPEFPTTPCIALTPKHCEETTRDIMKRGDYNGCSSYYKPSLDHANLCNPEKLVKVKCDNSTVKHLTALVSDIKSCTVQCAESTNNNYDTVPTTTKLEITQFEVIKENLPKDEAVKELKISSNTKDTICVTNVKTNCLQNDEKILVDGFVLDNEKSSNTNENSSDSDTSSTSSSTSSSSSSSSSSNSNITNTSRPFSSNKKYKRTPNKIYTDTSNDSISKINASIKKSMHDVSMNLTNDQMKDKVVSNTLSMITNVIGTDKTLMDIITKTESSPAKLFAINKNEEQLESTLKETPAKDENLLPEANISETPNSTKSGIENLTNLSSKISAFITLENEKSANINSSKHEAANPSTAIQKPRIINIQNITLDKSTFVPLADYMNKQKMLNLDEHAKQLEQKRQRMIAKLKEIPKSNVSLGNSKTKQSIISMKKKNMSVNKNYQLQHKMKTTISTRGRKRIRNISRNTNNIENTAEKAAKSNNINKNVQDIKKEEIYEKLSAIHSVNKSDKHIQDNNKNVGIETSSTVDKCVSEKAETNIEFKTNVEDYDISCIALKNDINILKDKPINEQELLKEKLSSIDTQEAKVQDVQNSDIDKKCNTKDNTNSIKYVEKIKDTLKVKVDQVKRDLFSDEENEQKSQLSGDLISKTVEITKKDECANDSNEVINTVRNTTLKDPKEELSCVLECLQLVPASKTDQHKEKNDDDQCEEQVNLNLTGPNSVEYHFVYDENISTKKRRRRFSSNELKMHVNVVLDDENDREVVKIITATDYQEIFNMNPKSKKKLINRKSPVKSEKNHEGNNLKTNNSDFILKDDYAKPLATSSPVDKPLLPKFKKKTSKTSIIEKDNALEKGKVQYEKAKIQKDNLTTKNQKRKLSESKDDDKMDKKQRICDPKVLLSNMNLDEFLTSVHGPT